jgi:5-methylcytosine-specific restriction endonuclease McrA
LSGDPYPKAQQLARSERRYRRYVASPKQWAAIAAAKQGRCRVCAHVPPNELHHLVPRGTPHFGSDVPENIAPLCPECHGLITRRDQPTIKAFLASLTDEEYAAAVETGGEDFWERAYGLRYDR